MRRAIICIFIGLIVIFAGVQIYNHFEEYNSFKNKKIKILKQITTNGKSYMDRSTGNREFTILSKEDREIIIHAIENAKPFRKDIMLKTSDILIIIGDARLAYNKPFIIFDEEPQKLYKLNKKDILKVDKLLLRLEEDYNKKQ
ncbi:hypothetical protein [Abyssisolibacter fermentans]|uniref:hypothetical protein n=1 Tax=Abyssisolibacter fermentans TaxID=1766203 RepID=UPI00082BE831|nr:hypothetical protein [Abyssisolibacter fermentans]